jgi:uncharacterized membrane protein
MINFEDPTILSLSSFGISFLVVMFLLWLFNPTWIQQVSKKGNKKKSTVLIVSYSLTFSIVVAIAVLLYISQNYKQDEYSFEKYKDEYSGEYTGEYNNSKYSLF